MGDEWHVKLEIVRGDDTYGERNLNVKCVLTGRKEGSLYHVSDSDGRYGMGIDRNDAVIDYLRRRCAL